jgi:hypothetical protein
MRLTTTLRSAEAEAALKFPVVTEKKKIQEERGEGRTRFGTPESRRRGAYDESAVPW